MPANAGTKPWEQKLHETGARVEEELRRIVTYIDDEVVPEVRRNSSTALRYAAEQMERLARHLDESRSAPPPPPNVDGGVSR
jgi:hypothetical protein